MANIWIKGDSKRSLLDSASILASNLLGAVTTRSVAAYNQSSIIPLSVERDEVLTVNRFVRNHPNLLDQAVQAGSYLDRFADYNQDEMTAVEVLLLAIEESLKEGFLENRALGELVEDGEK